MIFFGLALLKDPARICSLTKFDNIFSGGVITDVGANGMIMLGMTLLAAISGGLPSCRRWSRSQILPLLLNAYFFHSHGYKQSFHVMLFWLFTSVYFGLFSAPKSDFTRFEVTSTMQSMWRILSAGWGLLAIFIMIDAQKAFELIGFGSSHGGFGRGFGFGNGNIETQFFATTLLGIVMTCVAAIQGGDATLRTWCQHMIPASISYIAFCWTAHGRLSLNILSSIVTLACAVYTSHFHGAPWTAYAQSYVSGDYARYSKNNSRQAATG